MTEAEWLKSNTPNPLWLFLDDRKANVRKLRLYAVACCRRLELRRLEPVCALALDLSERLADGEEVGLHLYEAEEQVVDLQRSRPVTPVSPVARDAALSAVLHAASLKESLTQLVAAECAIRAIALSAGEAVEPTRYDEAHNAAQLAEEQAHCALLRDIFGNPFRPVTFAPDWRADTAVALARQMYETRAFGAMPILADALQDAGCNNTDILDHCRSPGLHNRGCWVVDLVLDKK
jgi:hypothetical protein